MRHNPKDIVKDNSIIQAIILGTIILMVVYVVTGCQTMRSGPKFHYMEKVKIIRGFYEDCVGNVINSEYNPSVSEDDYLYIVDLKSCPGTLVAPRALVGESIIESI